MTENNKHNLEVFAQELTNRLLKGGEKVGISSEDFIVLISLIKVK